MNKSFDLTEKEMMFLKQYAEVFDKERVDDWTNDPIVVVEQKTRGKHYEPIAYFLTRKEAETYCLYQSHNLGKDVRVYTHNCGYGNKGDMQCLTKLLLRMGVKLKHEVEL